MSFLLTATILFTLLSGCLSLEIEELKLNHNKKYVSPNDVDVFLKCKFSKEGVFVTWQKDGEELRKGYARPDKDKKSSKLELGEISFDTAGIYTCHVKDEQSQSEASKNFSLAVFELGQHSQDIDASFDHEDCSYYFSGGFDYSRPPLVTFCGVFTGTPRKRNWIKDESGKKLGFSSLDEGEWANSEEDGKTKLFLQDKRLYVSTINSEKTLRPSCEAHIPDLDGNPLVPYKSKVFNDIDMSEGEYSNKCPSHPFEEAENEPNFHVKYGDYRKVCRPVNTWASDGDMQSLVTCKSSNTTVNILCVKNSWMRIGNESKTFTKEDMNDFYSTCTSGAFYATPISGLLIAMLIFLLKHNF